MKCQSMRKGAIALALLGATLLAPQGASATETTDCLDPRLWETGLPPPIGDQMPWDDASVPKWLRGVLHGNAVRDDDSAR